jgi:hypothetical protein
VRDVNEKKCERGWMRGCAGEKIRARMNERHVKEKRYERG